VIRDRPSVFIDRCGALRHAELIPSDYVSYDYACMPDWVFYRDDKLTEAEVMPRLVADFPGFRPRWEKHP
jgi:hypothetical protein